MRHLFTLSLRQMLGGKKIWILAFFLSMPLLLVGAVLLAGGFALGGADDTEANLALSLALYVLYPQSLCILAALLYGASLLAGEIEDKTLVYLFTRSLPRWKVVVGKYVATCVALSTLTLASMTAAFVISGLPFGLKAYAGHAAAVVGACFAYTAIFCLLGLLVPRRAIPVGVIYAVVVEYILSTIPAVVNEFTTSYYLRSLAWHLADVPLSASVTAEIEREVEPFVAGADVQTAVVALAVISVVALVLSAVVVHRRQWPLTEGV